MKIKIVERERKKYWYLDKRNGDVYYGAEHKHLRWLNCIVELPPKKCCMIAECSVHGWEVIAEGESSVRLERKVAEGRTFRLGYEYPPSLAEMAESCEELDRMLVRLSRLYDALSFLAHDVFHYWAVPGSRDLIAGRMKLSDWMRERLHDRIAYIAKSYPERASTILNTLVEEGIIPRDQYEEIVIKLAMEGLGVS